MSWQDTQLNDIMQSIFNWCLISLSLAQLAYLCNGGAVFKLQLLNFTNPGGNDHAGSDCDVFSGCDNEFHLCIDRSDRTSDDDEKNCDYYSERTQEYGGNTVTFGSDFLIFGSDDKQPNPITMDIPIWPGSLKFKVKVWDDDNKLTGNDDPIDYLSVIIPMTRDIRQGTPPPPGTTIKMLGTRTKGQKTSLFIKTYLYCQADYYGLGCGVYCKSSSDSSGHNTCDLYTGEKQCIQDYYTEECDIYCKARNDSQGHYTCNATNGDKICLNGWKGSECDVLSCGDHDCQNNAACNETDTGYSCICALGFSGELCENNTDECESNPCQNNATCRDRIDHYECQCPDNYTGTNCEVAVTSSAAVTTTAATTTADVPATAAAASALSNNAPAVAIPMAIVCLLVVAALILLLVWKRRKKRKQDDENPKGFTNFDNPLYTATSGDINMSEELSQNEQNASRSGGEYHPEPAVSLSPLSGAVGYSTYPPPEDSIKTKMVDEAGGGNVYSPMPTTDLPDSQQTENPYAVPKSYKSEPPMTLHLSAQPDTNQYDEPRVEKTGENSKYDYPPTPGENSKYDYPPTPGENSKYDYPSTSGENSRYDFPLTSGENNRYDYPPLSGENSKYDNPPTSGENSRYDYPPLSGKNSKYDYPPIPGENSKYDYPPLSGENSKYDYPPLSGENSKYDFPPYPLRVAEHTSNEKDIVHIYEDLDQIGSHSKA